MAADTAHYLSRDTLESLNLTTEEVIESIERLLLARSQSRAWSAPKALITPPDGRYMMATLAAADDPPGLVNGDIPGRSGDSERTAYIFRGLALGDLALAGLSYRRACETTGSTQRCGNGGPGTA